MEMERRYVGPELANWDEIRDQHDWSGILIGNGASIAVWEAFHYASILEKAASPAVEHPLTAADNQIFAFMDTTNFETILGALRTSEAVCQAVGLDPVLIRQRHASIQRALVEAIKAVHVRWDRIPEGSLRKIGSALGSYSYVYTTNYDLLAYWAIMSLDTKGLVDYFWTSDRLAFDASNAEVWGKATKVLYLHGALHLYRLPSGETVKRRADAMALLDAVGTPYLESDMPLFVSEGASDAKMRAIRRSDYLSFAYTTFARHQGPLVIFGHSLGAADEHLLRALNAEPRLIAISLRRSAPAALTARKAILHEKLPQATLIFFDAVTHPLGDTGLKVRP